MNAQIIIYALFGDCDSACLYVGATRNLHNRTKQHRLSKRLKGKRFSVWIYRYCRSIASAAKSEREFIRKLKPLWNISKGGGPELFMSREQRVKNGKQSWATRKAKLAQQLSDK